MNDRKSMTLYISAMMIFGSIGLFRRFILLPSAFIACTRGIIGGIVIILFLLFTKHKFTDKLTGKNLFKLILSGAFIGINWSLLFEAYNYTEISIATLCCYMAPTFIIPLSFIFLKEKFSLKKIICCITALIGMAFVSGVFDVKKSMDRNQIIGIGLALSAAVFFAAVVILNKTIDYSDSYISTTIQLFSAGIVAAPYAFIAEFRTLLDSSFDLPSVLLLLVVGIVHTGLAYVLYFSAYKGINSQTLAIFSYIDPVFAIFLSAVLMGEVPTIFGIFGAVLIIGSAIASEIDFKSISKKSNKQH